MPREHDVRFLNRGARVRRDAQEASDAAWGYGRDAAHGAAHYANRAYDTGLEAQRQAQDIGQDAWNRAGELADYMARTGAVARKYARSEIRDYPISTVLASFGVGILIGMMLGSK